VALVLSAIQRSEPSPKIFLDYSGHAMLAHATYVYGGTPASPGLIRGHLAPWQARRAKQFLNANLYGDVSLASAAAKCNLSVSHFAHAFRPPHRWLMERRIDAVTGLLLTSRLPLAEIASKCGFADQSALTDLSNAFWERVRASGAGAEKAIIEQFPPRLTYR
jgi:AraC family transcriptional regulator